MRFPHLTRLAGTSIATLAALVLCVGCGSTTPPESEPSPTKEIPNSAAPTPTTPEEPDSTVSLAVKLYPDGSTLGSQYSLECASGEPIGQSQAPDPAAACTAIHEHSQILTPQRPGNQMCTEIYGGPDKAVVSGTLQGKEFSSEFTRSNGCLIAEWDALASLLGGGGL